MHDTLPSPNPCAPGGDGQAGQSLRMGRVEAVRGTGQVRAGADAGTSHESNVFEVTLPWPPKALSPNARTHWRKKAPILRHYKAACWALTKEVNGVVPAGSKLALWLDFYPPDRRHRDDDNMIASFKAGRDGLALALGIDDKRFRTFPYVQDKIGGYIKVRITQLPEQTA